MGQKINPISLRLGINRWWDSQWHSKLNYTELVHEDLQIRTYLQTIYEKASFLVGECKIDRSLTKTLITLSIAKPTDFSGDFISKHKEKKIDIEKLQQSLEKITKGPISLVVQERNCYESALLLAKDIAKKMEARQPFAMILKRSVKYSLNSGSINGIKIQCSGRLNGEDIARTEWVKEGEIPLHTLSANIDYAQANAYTIYGVCGIKVWISR